jgi:hypothetical protein
MFPYGNIHKYTWASPDGKARNQINRILIDRDGIRVYSMGDLSGELTVVLINIWWWQKLRKDWQ